MSHFDRSGNVDVDLGHLLIKSDGNIVLPKKASTGIKVDLNTPTFGFADIIGDQFAKNTGATKPSLTAYNGVVNAWRFAAGKEAYIR